MNGFCCFVFVGFGNIVFIVQCAVGYYCFGGQEFSILLGLECFAGYYCLQGFNYLIMCDNGIY